MPPETADFPAQIFCGTAPCKSSVPVTNFPQSGVFLISLAHAKGLEFDGVIMPDCNAENYPDTLLGRHRLYTALSRATRRLTVLARGAMTPLLEK